MTTGRQSPPVGSHSSVTAPLPAADAGQTARPPARPWAPRAGSERRAHTTIEGDGPRSTWTIPFFEIQAAARAAVVRLLASRRRMTIEVAITQTSSRGRVR